MSFKRALAGLLLAGALSGALFASPTTTRGPSSDRGLEIYGAYCIGCHGLNGQGDGPVAPRLQRDYGQSPTNLADSDFQQSRTDEQLSTAIRQGGQKMHHSRLMPSWGTTLTDAEVGDLVAFVRELRTGGEQAPVAFVQDELEQGRALYSLHCVGCHGTSGTGAGPLLKKLSKPDPTLPNLAAAGFYRTRSDEALQHSIDSRGHQALLREGGMAWQALPMSAAEKTALLYYLRALPLMAQTAR